MQKLRSAMQLSPWFYTFVFISLFLCFVTLFQHELRSVTLFQFELVRFTSIFNLRNENNLAALFSGMFLFIIALQAFDGWGFNRTSIPRVATAWLLLSFVLLALSLDEIGSLHETVHPFMKQLDFVGEWSSWWTLLPFGLLLVGMITYSLVSLFRAPGQRTTVVLMCIGFALLASVALQEYVEQNLDWSANRALRFFKARLRPVVEEGTELLGMLFLLWATLNSARGGLSDRERARFPVLEGVVSWRRPVLLLVLIGAPMVAYVTVNMPETRHEHGAPADWPAAALYLLAALGAARSFFISGHRLGGLDWALIAIATLGCASTILPPDSPIALPVMTILSGAAFLIWFLGPRYLLNEYLLAVIFLSIGLAGAWLVPHNDIIVYTLAQYTALAMYWVNTSNSPPSVQNPRILTVTD